MNDYKRGIKQSKQSYKKFLKLYTEKIQNNYYLIKKDLHSNMSPKPSKNKKEILGEKKFKTEILYDFISVMLDDLNSFFLFKLVTESYMELFFNYFKDIKTKNTFSIMNISSGSLYKNELTNGKKDQDNKLKDLNQQGRNDLNVSSDITTSSSQHKCNKKLNEEESEILNSSSNNNSENIKHSPKNSIKIIKSIFSKNSEDCSEESINKSSCSYSEKNTNVSENSSYSSLESIYSSSDDSSGVEDIKTPFFTSFGMFIKDNFGTEYYTNIISLEKKFKKYNKKLVKIENSIIDWYILMLSENEIEKNKLFRYFIKEYNERKKMVTEKYLEFFKLDQQKHFIEKNAFISFEGLSDETKNLLSDCFKEVDENGLIEKINK